VEIDLTPAKLSKADLEELREAEFAFEVAQ
jgi:hypothetical protein